jgi:hypothetical protein
VVVVVAAVAMLPRVNVVVPTGEFHELDMDEERVLNEDDNGDPIMGEPFQRSRGPNDDGATFRIRSYAADGTTPVYRYYIAEYLWQWARRGNRTDPTRAPWRYSDWMALRNQFEPNFPIPNWVRALEANDLRVVRNGGNETWYWNDNHTTSRLVRVENADGTTKHFEWNDAAQRRYLAKITYAAPYNENYSGSEKRYRFYDQPDPAKQNYDSDTNWSQLVSWRNDGKWSRHYTGPGSGGERLLRQMFLATAELWHYATKPGDNLGDEHLTKIKFLAPSRLAGQTWIYDGNERGGERKVYVEHEYSEQVDFYEGLPGVEHKIETRFKDHDGQTVSIFFQGVKRFEKVSKVVAWGQQHIPPRPQPPQVVAESVPVEDMSTDDEGHESSDDESPRRLRSGRTYPARQ